MPVAKKIRIYPENERLWFRCTHAARRAYNLAIEAYRDRDPRTPTELRRDIRQQVIQEYRDDKIPSVVLDEAVNEAFRTHLSVVRRRSAGEKCDYRFRSRKMPRQGFLVQKLASTPYPKILGPVHVTEPIPEYAKSRLARVNHEYGRWFLICQQETAISRSEIQGLKIASVDPGVRTFATVFSFDTVAKIGERIFEKVLDLARQLDKLCSERQKFVNKAPKDWSTWTQWHRDWWRFYEKRINRLRNRASDLVGDLHKRAAHWLTEQFDVIFLPSFEVKGMVAKLGRKINRKTVRNMLGLGHYKFKQFLQWVAHKKGKHVVIVNESYTSKTDSRTGEVKEKLGGAKMLNGLDRDVNGARGILLRALTR